MKSHGNKWVTALPRFPCFRNLLGYNLKWESVIKTTIYRERKNNDFNSDKFSSNAVWFGISINNMNKTKKTFYR